MNNDVKMSLLVVDSNPATVNPILQTLKKSGYKTLQAREQREVLEAIKKVKVDAVLLGIKTEWPGETNPYRKILNTYPHMPIVLLTSHEDINAAADAVKKGAYDFIIVDPYDEIYLLRIVKKTADYVRASQIELRYQTIIQEAVQKKTMEYNEAVARTKLSTREMVQRLLKAAEFRDDDTGNHVKRIGMYATVISASLRLDNVFNETIAVSSSMHDIGKIGIPDSVLLKTSGLTPQEFETMKQHTAIGYKILAGSDSSYLKMAANIAMTHHERYDGTGYPNGLRGNNIPMESRIVNVCDQYDALRSKRPYKNPLDHATTFQIITKGDGRTKPEHFDPAVLAAFVKAAPIFKEVFDSNNV
jgi:putative two-component system response regulator